MPDAEEAARELGKAMTFMEEKVSLPGNLSSNLSKLEDAGYVEIEKGYAGKKPRTRLRLTAVGVAVGLGGALATSRILEGVMVGLQARNPVVYVVVAAGLVAVAAVAAYLPARRATRIDPVEALRPE